MLRLRRIEIDNLVCFDNVVIEPSTDPERPLTVLRAENGSGKTTFLRALRWGMYGERGLPGNSTRFSLHPAWWRPSDDGIKTKVLDRIRNRRLHPTYGRKFHHYRLSACAVRHHDRQTSVPGRRARLPPHQRTYTVDGQGRRWQVDSAHFGS